MGIYNVHAGHNPANMVGCGAVGLINESTENRNVCAEVIKQLRALGHTVYDCTVNDGTSSSNVLTKIVNKCNAHTVDYDISIHFNAGANNKSGNGVTTGTEVLIYNLNDSKTKAVAQSIANEISALGFRNRGVKQRQDLYVLRKTKAKAMLIECCFVDDKDDVNLYNTKKMASAIVKGLTGQVYVEDTKPVETKPTPAPTPAPAKKSNEQVAGEVIKGLWGNGADRRTRLTQAGYNYDTIQSIVNSKLGAKPAQPAKKSNEAIAKEVIQGKWGNGKDRQNRLTSAGYDYRTIQNLVNKMLR